MKSCGSCGYTAQRRRPWCFWFQMAGFALCVVLAIGGLLLVIASLVVSAWVGPDLGVRLMVTGIAAVFLGGIPWMVMVT